MKFEFDLIEIVVILCWFCFEWKLTTHTCPLVPLDIKWQLKSSLFVFKMGGIEMFTVGSIWLDLTGRSWSILSMRRCILFFRVEWHTRNEIVRSAAIKTILFLGFPLCQISKNAVWMSVWMDFSHNHNTKQSPVMNIDGCRSEIPSWLVYFDFIVSFAQSSNVVTVHQHIIFIVFNTKASLTKRFNYRQIVFRTNAINDNQSCRNRQIFNGLSNVVRWKEVKTIYFFLFIIQFERYRLLD